MQGLNRRSRTRSESLESAFTLGAHRLRLVSTTLTGWTWTLTPFFAWPFIIRPTIGSFFATKSFISMRFRVWLHDREKLADAGSPRHLIASSTQPAHLRSFPTLYRPAPSNQSSLYSRGWRYLLDRSCAALRRVPSLLGRLLPKRTSTHRCETIL